MHSRPAEIMPGIILEYLAYLGIRELCGKNRGIYGNNCTCVLLLQSRLGLGVVPRHRRRIKGPELVDDTSKGRY